MSEILQVNDLSQAPVMKTNGAKTPQNNNFFGSIESFVLLQRIATGIASSNIIPTHFQNNIGNCMIAVSLANRMNMDLFFVMQSLHIIHGKPSWSAQYMISAINSCGKFVGGIDYEFTNKGGKPIKYKLGGVDKVAHIDNICCVAAIKTVSGKIIRGVEVSMEMACKEGWYDKAGSKWQTMPEMMLTYRAAAFLCRAYCPEVLNGMYTMEEIEDITPDVKVVNESDAQPEVVTTPAAEIIEPKRGNDGVKEKLAAKSSIVTTVNSEGDIK